MKKIALAVTIFTAFSIPCAMADDSLKISQSVNESICNVSTGSLSQDLQAVDYNAILAEAVTGSVPLTLENCADGETPVITVSAAVSTTNGLALKVGNSEGATSDPTDEPIIINGAKTVAGASEATLHYNLSIVDGATYPDVVGDHDFTLTLAHSYK